MGTETALRLIAQIPLWKMFVKLNNPLMGTETLERQANAFAVELLLPLN